ncbi:MAG: glutamate-1-semialdehyde-2,1-aminomutase [Desulfonatronovibrio sp. MSAO_Bac4]|nr:MAG: glutamate-1-semialdehyde-2,1-aminomutase [Desulfonatronovibrio sp. MSAO_Bac4]
MTISGDLFEQARKIIPGGVNSPVRTCAGVGADPLFISKANGAYIHSEDGHKMVDYVMSWGPMLLGHNHPEVNKTLHDALDRGTSFGAPCQPEIDLAGLIVDALPGVDMVRMVNSGTEATMSALRLSRGYTGRSLVLKFTGCYHGHVDAFLASAGSGAATLCIPGTPGVPQEVVANTLLADYNNLEQVREIFAKHGQDIAAIFVEPVAGNMGLVLPQEGFLQGLRDIADEYGSLLVFDEVITGFRVSYSGAQGYYNIIPDMTCLGKIIGGGLPVGAYGGKKEIMNRIAPCGDVYQAGTLSGNPLAMTAGYYTLKTLKEMDYDQLAADTVSLAESLKDILIEKGVPVSLNTISSIFTLFFTDDEVHDFDSAKKSDQDLFKKFYNQMRDQGIYLAPSGFECAFNSFAHGSDEWEKTLEAARKLKF